MHEELNNVELNRLAKVGASDSNGDISTHSIATSIVASVMYCSPSISTITTVVSAVSTVVSAASTVFGCGKEK
ncbi:hypothetical protein ACSXB0_16110 (plasmid) [Clostridium perfringens]|uniref:Type 2 lantibiotic n=1 Tax=Clostridium perfringens TaxID=1502 RepID=A0A2X2XUT4_CLOPF|nr:hypothetical protein [Clostridium perfringens]NGT74030.1 hypothetical protein [Clostridium perfringens]SQB59472.1 Uncharacterised protein [Clostridium perfringens]